MLRVCHITSAHKPEDVRIFRKECISLHESGYDVTLVQRGDSYEKNGVHIKGIGFPSGGRFKRMTTFAHKAYKEALTVDADIYQIHDPELLIYALKLKKQGKFVVFDSHENMVGSILEKYYLPTILRRIVSRSYELLQNYVCRRLDAVVTVSPDLVAYFENINKKVVQVANYPQLKKLEKERECTSNKLIFAGGVSPQWNLHHVINVLPLLKDCELCICGPIEGDYQNTLRSSLGWKYVDYKGILPFDDVDKELNESSIGLALLTPGYNTDFNNGTMGNTKIFEEMMAGLPVVCTDFKRWRGFIEKYNCGICVAPDDEDSILKAVQFLIDNPEVAHSMGKNGYEAVRKEFNWDVEKNKLIALYDSLINE